MQNEFSNEHSLEASILDRLIDLEPGTKSENRPRRTQVLQQIKASVGRDLQNLLNTRCRATSIPEGLSELDCSLVSYGIPDCVGISTGSREQQEHLRQTIAKAISVFEPRLTNVRVIVTSKRNRTDRSLRFRIDAMLRIDPELEPVAYDSRLDATIGEFSVDGVRR